MNSLHQRRQAPTALWVAVTVLTLPLTAHAELIVALHANPVVDSQRITLADVADITATTNNEGTIAGHIDLEEFRSGKSSLIMNRSYIRIRLMVAGWGPDELRISGPEKIVVEYEEPEPIADTEIEAAATRTMQQMLGVPADEIRVRLSGPFVASLPTKIRQRPDLRIEVLPPSTPRWNVAK